MYMLDTNTLIYFFKNLGEVKKNLLLHSPKEILIPSIVLYELEVGIAKSNSPTKRKNQLSALSKQVNIVDFTQKDAKESALIRAYLEKRGETIGAMDILIAGLAKANNATLVTHNTNEFKRVKDLRLEDWF